MDTISDVESTNTIYPVNAVRESRKIRSMMASILQGNRNMLQFEYWQNNPTATVKRDTEPKRK
jgi:hypothetical protein